MLFNSYAFLFVYLPVVFGGFFLCARVGVRTAASWLGLASVAFYGYWNPAHVPLLLASIAFNFAVGTTLARDSRSARNAKLLLSVGVAVNLALLCYYKYAGFLVANLNTLSGWEWKVAASALPLGVSFFTFTQIAFLVDAHRGRVREYDFLRYLLFVTFFPHLVAGPVLHHGQMMPQFAQRSTYRLDWTNLASGMTIFAIGLFKKVVIADGFAPYADGAFDAVRDGAVLGFAEAWVGVTAYALQLYFDFSGYSDMAIGLARLFNIRLPLNFDSPYKAVNIVEFWRRWHITLSTFLRDYLYIPLGGNRHGTARRHVNLMATMLLGGLWHGAGWTFVIWGGLHGAYLVVNHGWQALASRLPGRSARRGPLGAIVSAALTFVAVLAAWVFFRADSVDTALRMLQGMAGSNGLTLPASWQFLAPAGAHASALFGGAFPHLPWEPRATLTTLGLGLAIVWLLPNTQQFMGEQAWPRGQALAWRPTPAGAAIAGVALAYSLLRIDALSPFLYFQF
jgi:alginate O-acetyltransferase complex protein AlgI